MTTFNRSITLGLLLLLECMRAHAGDRLIATGGVTEIEGAAGGGLTTWALIAGYCTRDQGGIAAFDTNVHTNGGFNLNSGGLNAGIYDRVELSYAYQRFGLSDTVPGTSLGVDIFGMKVKVAGDAVFDQDRWLPQVAVGVQYKHDRDFTIPKALGASHADGLDVYVAATKLYLAAVYGRNLLLNVTLRATKANQFGILGFGGDLSDRYRLQPEFAGGLFLTDNVVLGGEYRMKPNNLSSFVEQDAGDVYLAVFPDKHIALVAAWTDLGNIANKPHQQGLYVSLQVGF